MPGCFVLVDKDRVAIVGCAVGSAGVLTGSKLGVVLLELSRDGAGEINMGCC